MLRKLTIAVIATGLIVPLGFVCGCESDAQTGAALGALAGAGVGQLAGRDTKSTLIGAAIGGGAGYIIGNESDKKKAKAEMDTVEVKITNSNGSISTVKLKKQGVGYVGPRGEYYDHLPTSEELRPVYGF